MILSPEHPVTTTIAAITISGNLVLCSFKEHNEKFRGVLHSLSFGWSEYYCSWRRTIDTETNGACVDRAAELGAALLTAGFIIDTDDVTGKTIQDGAWKQEQKAWVIEVNGKFGLHWKGEDDNLWQRAKLLPDTHWDKDTKSLTVPPLYCSEVIGFAEAHDFAFTQAATALLRKAERDYSRVVLPDIPKPVEQNIPKRKRRFCNPANFLDMPERKLVTTTELFPYQVAAVDKILPLRIGALFMDMGTGKTRCAIELSAKRQQRISKVVWFCPVGLKITIAEEIEKHSNGEPVYIFDDETTSENIPPAFWYIVGIESMSSSDRTVLAVNSLIDTNLFVIVDESSYIKGHTSRRSMRITEIGKRARYRLLLTGTPLSQGIEDLYAQMRFLSPDILGYNSFYSFAHNHLEYSDKYPGLIVRAHNSQLLADKIAPYVYQVTKDECLDLPGKLYDQVYYHLTDEQRDAYEQAKIEILLDVDIDQLKSYTIFKLFTALQQIVSGFWNRDGKQIEFPHHRLETLQTSLDNVPENQKVIIWTKYIYSLKKISEVLSGAALYYGDLSEQKRQAEIERFRDDDCRFLVATQATGGHGLTLNEAHYHIFYENEFKYSHRIQAEDRSYRIGQTEPITYIDLVSTSGIDRRIQKALSKKEDVVKAFRAEVKKVKDLKSL